MAKKFLKKVPKEYVVEALQVVTNYCNQSVKECDTCFLRMREGSCLFKAELPDRFEKWKKEKNGSYEQMDWRPVLFNTRAKKVDTGAIRTSIKQRKKERAMTREEAIDFAEFLKNNWIINFAEMEEFCDIAIEALQAEPKHGIAGRRWIRSVLNELER